MQSLGYDHILGQCPRAGYKGRVQFKTPLESVIALQLQMPSFNDETGIQEDNVQKNIPTDQEMFEYCFQMSR